MAMYHDGNRELQDRFGARPLADRLVERLWRDRFKDDDKAFIESVGFFFLATADVDGHPDCSFKGGPPGFVKVPAPDLLVFPELSLTGYQVQDLVPEVAIKARADDPVFAVLLDASKKLDIVFGFVHEDERQRFYIASAYRGDAVAVRP